MIKRELTRFLVVGLLAVMIDFLIYRGLVLNAAITAFVAKGSSFLIGTMFAYFANRFWTFGYGAHVAGSFWRFGLLYISTLIVNVIINAIILRTLEDTPCAVRLAFLGATGISALLNFLGMKRFVFADRDTS